MGLKSFLEQHDLPINRGLFLVYGKAGVGKTTFLMEFAASCNGKALIIDAENGFNVERFKQISGEHVELDNLLVAKPKDFEDQAKIISNVLDNEKLFDFIGVDTIGKNYREPSREDRTKANNEIARQMRILKEISRKKPVVVCNQVYQDIKKNKVAPVGRHYVTKWCDYVIFLDDVNNVRTLEVAGKKTGFTLTASGFSF